MQKDHKLIVQLSVAAALLIALCFLVGWNDLAKIATEIEIPYVIALLAISAVMIWVSCLKWQLFLVKSSSQISMTHLMKLYTVGYFINLFSPSFVGGDVVRSYQIGKKGGSQAAAFVSTFLERFTGLLAMAILGLLFVFIGSEATQGIERMVALFAAVTISGAVVIACRPLRKIAWNVVNSLCQKLKFRGAARVEKILGEIEGALHTIHSSPKLLLWSFLLSFLFHALTVANTYFAARAIGWENPDIAGLFVVVPLVLIVSVVPLTPSGIGVQEGAFFYFLQHIGATRAEALAVGLILRLKVVLIGLLGGLIVILDKSPRNAAVEKELHEPCGELGK